MWATLCLAAVLARGDGPELATEWVTVTEGLPSNWTTEVTQDQRGALWIGGSGWVATYDGARMRSWELPGPSQAVQQILPREGTDLTIRVFGGAVSAWHDGTTDAMLGPDGAALRAEHLADAGEGELLAIIDGELWARGDDAGWRRRLESVDGEPLRRVFVTGRGELLLATANAAFVWSPGSAPRRVLDGVVVHRAAFDGDITWLLERSPTRLWRLSPEGASMVLERPEVAKDLTFREGTLWVAFSLHLAVVDRDGGVEIIEATSPTGNTGRILASSDGSLWSTNFRGLAHLPDPDLRRWPLTEGSNPISARSVVARDGEVWVGSWNGLYRVREGGAVDDASPLIGKGRICHGPDGALWSMVGSTVTGDLHWIAWDDAGEHRLHPAAQGDPWTFGCAVGQAGRHWLTVGAQLYALGRPDETPRAVAEHPLAPSNQVRSIVETRDGVLWVAAGRETCWASVPGVLAGEASWTCHTLPPSLGSIEDLHETARGRVWLADRYEGLLEFVDGEPRVVPGSEAIGLGDLRGLSHSPAGGSWVAGIGAVVRVVDEPEGLRIVESVPDWLGRSLSAIADVLELEDGTLYLAGDTGLLQIPARVRQQAEPPPPAVWVSELLVDGRAVQGDRVDLEHGEQTVTLHLSSPNYRAPAQLRYRHRVDERPWSAPSSAPSIVLASLPPGPHRVELAASLDAERWSKQPSVIWVHVPQPWYERRWVWALALVGCVSLALAIARARSELAARAQRLRTQVAMDIHDELGAGLAAMGLLAGLIRRGLSPRRTQELAGRIATEAHELGDGVSAIVWSLSPRSNTLGALIEYLDHRASSILADFDPALRPCRCDPGLAELPVDIDVLRALQLVGLEALNNAARHAQATQVEVRVERGAEGVRLTIVDDGVGLPLVRAPAPDRGRGLGGMETRMRGVGGRLEVLPGAVGGTRVEAHFRLRRGWRRVGRRPEASA
ncbi:MAG: two-component regulator propeller domain-containing protein [Myxococcota bacterium]